MATTMGPQTQPQPTNNNKMNRLVYSKYRELLGSYNGKANTIIESLPTFMVREDRGFNKIPIKNE